MGQDGHLQPREGKMATLFDPGAIALLVPTCQQRTRTAYKAERTRWGSYLFGGLICLPAAARVACACIQKPKTTPSPLVEGV